jgi:myosin heavy subunit
MTARIVPTMYYPVNINGNIVRMPLMMNIDKVTDSNGKKTISMEDVEKKIKEMCKNCDGNITKADKKELLKSVKQNLMEALQQQLATDEEIVAKKREIIASYEQMKIDIDAIQTMKQDISRDQQEIESIKEQSQQKLENIEKMETTSGSLFQKTIKYNKEIESILKQLNTDLTDLDRKKQQFDANLQQFEDLLNQKKSELQGLNVSDFLQELDVVKQQATQILQKINDTKKNIDKHSAEIAAGAETSKQLLDSITDDVERIKRLTTQYEQLQQGIETAANQIIDAAKLALETATEAAKDAEEEAREAGKAATEAIKSKNTIMTLLQKTQNKSEEILASMNQLLSDSTDKALEIQRILQMVEDEQQSLLELQKQVKELEQSNIAKGKLFEKQLEELQSIIREITTTHRDLQLVISTFAKHKQEYSEMTAKLGKSQEFFTMNLEYYFNFTIVVISMVKVLVNLFSGKVNSSRWAKFFGATSTAESARKSNMTILNENLLNVVTYLITSLETINDILKKKIPEGEKFNLDIIKQALKDLNAKNISFDDSPELNAHWGTLILLIDDIQELQPESQPPSDSEAGDLSQGLVQPRGTALNKYQVGGYNYNHNYLDFAKSVCSSFL